MSRPMGRLLICYLNLKFGFENWKGETDMAQDFSREIYNGRRWRKTAKAFAASKCYICERCHNRSFIGSGRKPRYIVHHKTPLTPDNIHDESIVYGWDNLELLCIDCHNTIHDSHLDRECMFDEHGTPIGIHRHLLSDCHLDTPHMPARKVDNRTPGGGGRNNT